MDSNQKLLIISLSLFLFVGALLRFWGIGYGLPDLLHYDEPFEINRALRLASGDIEMDRGGKGGFFYFVFLEFAASFVLLYIFGIVKSASDFSFFYVSHEPAFYLMARMISAIFGILSLLVIYQIGKRQGGRLTGLLSCYLLAISTMTIKNAHYATVDITLVLFLLLTWLFIIAFLENPVPRNLYLIALCGAFSIVTKLPGIIIIIPMFFMVLWYFYDNYRNNTEKKISLKHFPVAIIIFFTLIFALEPGYINLVKEKMSKQSKEMKVDTIKEATPTYKKPNLFLFYFKQIYDEFKAPLLVIFGLSIFTCIFLRLKIELLFLSFIVPFLIAISTTSSGLYYSRYILPMIPLMILLISKEISIFETMLSKRNNQFVPSYLTVGIFVALIIITIPNLLSSIEVSQNFWEKDRRIAAKEWVYNNIPAGSKIMMTGHPEHYSQRLVPLVNSKENIDALIKYLEKETPGKAKYWKLRRKYLNGLNIPRYDLTLNSFGEAWMSYEAFKKSGIGYVIFDENDIRREYTNVNSAKGVRAFYEAMVSDPDVERLATFSDRISIFHRSIRDATTDDGAH